MDIFILILRLALAGIFGVAGIAKFFDPEGLRKAFADFDVPKPLVEPLAYLLPLAEVSMAISLLFTGSSWYGAVAGAVLLAAFTAGMLVQIAKGKSPDCHCFGQLHSEPVGISSVVRNTVMLALAAFLAARGAAQGAPLVSSQQDVLFVVLGLVTITVLLSGVLFLKQISEQQVQIMRRIELLEFVAHEGTSVEREDAGHPHDGLPIGALVPDFELPDLDGRVVSLESLKAAGQPVLFLYVGPTCAPCASLIPDLDRWEAELKDRVKLVFISSGKADENREKFAASGPRTILLQEDRRVSDLLMAKWTPSAILMGADGRIAAHLVAGDMAIREMVSGLLDADLGSGFTHYSNGNGHSHAHAPTKVRVGEAAPEFEVTDIDGNVVRSSDLRGKQTLVTFWSSSCPHCMNMLPDLRQWDLSRGDTDPNLVILSDGDPDAHKDMGLRSPVIIEPGQKTASALGAFGTPSAVLISEDGRFMSETAVGAESIWSLIGKRK